MQFPGQLRAATLQPAPVHPVAHTHLPEVPLHVPWGELQYGVLYGGHVTNEQLVPL